MKGHMKTLKEYQVVIKPYGKYINVLAVPDICSTINNQWIKEADKSHSFLGGIKLADDGNYSNLPIGVLLGSDYYWKIVDGDIRKVDNSGLVALNSALGWLLSGPVQTKDKMNNNPRTNTMIVTHVMKVGIAPEEKSVYEKFNEEIEFKKGRYDVKLPSKEYRQEIPENKNLAESRLRKQTERLQRDQNLMKMYDDVFKEQLANGIIEEIADEDKGEKGMTTYLLHQPVINEKNPSKFRVVLDCSAKERDGVRLNDVLYKGPTMLNKLFDLMIKFRVHYVK